MYKLLMITGFLLPAVSQAHHSATEFGDEVREINGVLVTVFWRNPHAGFEVRVTNDDGSEELWRVDATGNPNSFRRMGVEREQFQEGDTVRFAGRLSTRRPLRLLGNNVLFETGLEAVLHPNGEPMWSNRYVGGAAQFTSYQAKRVDAASENLGIFRYWSIDRMRPRRSQYVLTDAAQQAVDAWDPLQSPIARCEPPGMPLPTMSPRAIELVDNGATISLRAEYFDTTRTIHMGGAIIADSQPRNKLGNSIGRWEGATLVVETTQVSYPLLNADGIPQSEQARFVERFTLGPDQSELSLHMTITDPVNLLEPVIFERQYTALDASFEALDCSVF